MAGTRAKEATDGNGPSYPPAVAETADTPLAAMTAASTTAAKLRMASLFSVCTLMY